MTNFSLLVLPPIKSGKRHTHKDLKFPKRNIINLTFLMYQKKADSLNNDDSCEDAHQNYQNGGIARASLASCKKKNDEQLSSLYYDIYLGKEYRKCSRSLAIVI